MGASHFRAKLDAVASILPPRPPRSSRFPCFPTLMPPAQGQSSGSAMQAHAAPPRSTHHPHPRLPASRPIFIQYNSTLSLTPSLHFQGAQLPSTAGFTARQVDYEP